MADTLIRYSYIKRRSEFGKQCVFQNIFPVAQEQIWPDPRVIEDYVIHKECDVHVQACEQIAAHEVQTVRKCLKNTGVLHEEGGWPREINPRDNEAVHGFRRRAEREDNWILSMTHLMPLMEHCVFQNNAVNIHENYFDDLIPTPLVKEYDIRIRNSYEDPQSNVRPIRSLSWSPNSSNRLAAAYSFAEFEEQPFHANPSSYVWDIENPNRALSALKSPSPLMAVEFNPHDPSLLVSGLKSGQVCSWDIRTNDQPVETSHPFHSHEYPATQAFWITSKANSEFFSSSIDGTIKWWDIRFMRSPTNSIVMDLEDPTRMDRFRAVGVTAIQFEPTISSRFLAGMENGVIVNVNNRSDKLVEKLAMRFKCYEGPVVTIDRNPVMPKNFLTIGDWSAKVWSDDTREGCLLSTRDTDTDLSGGCWSRSRCSVFFVINKNGLLEVYDILMGVRKPLTSIHICDHSLTAINAHVYGELLAVGNCNGCIYLLQCTEALTTFTKNDRANLSTYLEECSRFEKMVDSRLKEIRLLQDFHQEELAVRTRKSESKGRKKDSRDKKKSVATKSVAGEKEKRETSKKTKRSKSKARGTVTGDPELAAAEQYYFRTIEAESAKMEELDPADVAAAKELLQQRIVTKPEEKEEESEKEEPKKDGKSIRVRRFKSRGRRKRAAEGSDETDTEKESIGEDIDFDLLKGKATKRPRILKSCPMKVCKPEICCKDVVEEIKSQRLLRTEEAEEAEKVARVMKPFRVKSKWYQTLSEYANETPERPFAFKRKMLILKEIPPNVLREVLATAKSEIRAWQERVLAGRLSFRAVEKKIESGKQMETEQEPAKEEKTPRKVSVAKEAPRTVRMEKQTAKKGTRRRRRAKLTEEEIAAEEEAKKEERWRKIKQRVKEFEASRESKGAAYPRISAAVSRKSSDDIRNSGTK